MLTKKRKLILISLLIITPIGFYSKFYRGPAEVWVNDSLSGVFYEIFWCLFISFLLKKDKPLLIATTVLIITCILEFLQLWHPALLEVIRRTFLGRTLIGNSFTWTDFPYYFIGCWLGWLWLKWIQRVAK